MRNDSLKNRVKELRVRLDLRQSDLAREIGVTRQTILAIEKGRLNPSINIALKAARVLREPVDYVFYLDHEVEAMASGNEEMVVSHGEMSQVGGEVLAGFSAK